MHAIDNVIVTAAHAAPLPALCNRFVARAAALALALLVVACVTPRGDALPGAALAGAAPSAPPGLRLPADARPLHYVLDLDIDARAEVFHGRVSIAVQLDTARQVLWLHGRHLDVGAARVAGRSARYAEVGDDGMAALVLDAPVGPGVVDVQLHWTARYHPALEAVYRAEAGGDPYVFTQFEPVSAREAFPCFDEPGFKTPWTLSITTRGDDIALANTPEVSRTSLPDGRRRFAFATSQPLPTYLVAFAAGPLEVVEAASIPSTSVRAAPVPLRGVAVRGQGARLAASLEVTRAATLALERWFGIPYPYDKLDVVAVPDFAAGAMENAGLITFRDTLLFANAGSSMEEQRRSVGVIVHELAHQWFGNLVTMAWWDDLWLNEAFASWLPVEIIEELRPDLRARTAARSDLDEVTRADSLVSARQVRQPIVTTGDILNSFDGITYDKGAAVIGMFAHHVGEEAFREGVRRYLRAHAFGTATADDLLRAISSAAGRDIAGAFSTFLTQPGVPQVSVRRICDGDGPPAVELSQQRFLPVGSTGTADALWQIPVCLRVDAPASVGSPLAPPSSPICTLLSSRSARLPLPGNTCPRSVHPNADGRGYYRWTAPPAEVRALVASRGALTPGERISLANAIGAMEEAAVLSFEDALAAALPLARDDEPAVARAPLALLTFAVFELLEGDARARARALTVETYAEVLASVGLAPRADDDGRTRDLRALATEALVLVAEDPAATTALAALSDARGDGGAARGTAGLPQDLAGLALRARVRAGTPETWRSLYLQLINEQDSLVRRYLIQALADVHDPALLPRALALPLDPALKSNEVELALRALSRSPNVRDKLWRWLGARLEGAAGTTAYEALTARLPEGWADAAVASELNRHCSAERADEIDRFFRALPRPTSSLPRALSQTLESIRLCAARREAHRESASRTFAR